MFLRHYVVTNWVNSVVFLTCLSERYIIYNSKEAKNLKYDRPQVLVTTEL